MGIDKMQFVSPEESLQKDAANKTETAELVEQPTMNDVLEKIENEKPKQIPTEVMLYHLLPDDVRVCLSAEAKDMINNYEKENEADVSAAELYAENFYSKVEDHKIEMEKIGYGEILNKIEDWSKNTILTEKVLKIIENEKPKLIPANDMPIELFYYQLLPDEMKSSLGAKETIKEHLEKNRLFMLKSEAKAKELLSQDIGMNDNVYKAMVDKIEKWASEIKE